MNNNTIIKTTPKDFFLHLLNIFTFYLAVISLITLYIQYISALFPDPLNFYYTSMANSVRLSTAILIITIPVYIFTSWLLEKDLVSNYEKKELKLRKWLTYFTLFISAVTIIIDLIMFVFSFLSGELTIQFFLKVFVVILVSAAVFGYYIWDLKRKNIKSKIPKMLALILFFVVLSSIVVGFFIIGTPFEQRQRRFDEERISNLQVLQSQIINYWIQKESLPQNLNELENSIFGYIVPVDPESDLAYEYIVIDALSFELCAIFKTSTDDLSFTSQGLKIHPYDSFQYEWKHEAERTCFARTIDPELYKNNLESKEIVPLRY
jgi:hypothetical protein